jgi:hypothetical protein
LLAEQQHDRVQNQAVRYIDLYVDTFLRAIIGVVILGLFLLRPREREYLWFACVQLFGGADDIVDFFHFAYGFIPIPLFDLFDAVLAAGFWVAGLFFFATVLNQRRGLWFRIALILAILSPLCVTLYWYGWVPVPVASVLAVLFVLPSLVWVLSVLMVRSLRGDPEARLLLLPTLLLDGFYLAFNAVSDFGQLGWWPGAPDLLNYRFHFVPFDFGLYTIFNIIFLVAMLAFLIRRFSLGRRQEERLLGEFEAARQVQHLLVPEAAVGISGFAIDSVYVPAETVGGDFFQQIPDNRGGVLIVVGDVAGKGLSAAMLVSMLVGSIRTEAAHTHDPAALLMSLNERLLGRMQGGFATCVAARISSSGELVIANAGHIPPWRNGSALELPGSLPLGIVSNPEYGSETFRLAPDDQLTFVSDGVVEARSSSGELFGFERTGEISGQSAEEIAEAAKQFGQEDDITVLTLAFAPVGVLSA